MNAREIGKLLGVCASFDRRKVGDADTLAWTKALHDLDYHDAEVAVVEHYTATTEWITASHVRARVKAKRRDRIERAGFLIAPPDGIAEDSAAYIEWLRGTARRIGDDPDRPAVTDGRDPRAIEGER